MFCSRIPSICRSISLVFLVFSGWIVNTATPLEAQTWLDSSVIYCVYPEIFSSNGFQGVTAQLPRLKDLGVNVIWLMPVTTVGLPYNGHPAFDSPYAVHDFYSVNASYGIATDLTNLIQTAHGLGMKVILDEVLNQTSWDNALTSLHPEYYVHSDGNPNNPNSEVEAFTYADVAQLDYKTPGNGLEQYMDTMLTYWITQYDVDGFRFDSADNPYGTTRMIPQSFWQQLRPVLEATKPDILMLGEEDDIALAQAPFELDYGWNMQSALQAAATTGNSAAGLQTSWQNQSNGWPAGMRHMTLLQDWDLGEDLQVYAGTANTMAAAVFNYTIDGVPLLFNGEEVANVMSSDNTHNMINWNSPDAAQFTLFYTQLIGLRSANPALQQGALTWETNSASAQVVTYDRADAGSEFLIEINFSGNSVSGTVTVPAGGAWTDVTPAGAPGGKSHLQPGSFTLLPYDFAIFQRTAATTAPLPPSGLTATPSSGQAVLYWTAGAGATSYDVFRATSAGGEGSTPIAKSIAGTTYTDTGLTNGTTYYYEVASVNSIGTSVVSNEASATPQAPPVVLSFTVSGTAVSVTAGATVANTSAITVTPSGGFTGNVVLTAALASSPANAQYLPTFSFGTTTPVIITGSGVGTATLTISTTANTASALLRPLQPGIHSFAAESTALACLLWFGITARRRKWSTFLGPACFLAILAGGVEGCGASGSASATSPMTTGTTPGTYSITVTATSGTTVSTFPVSLTVK